MAARPSLVGPSHVGLALLGGRTPLLWRAGQDLPLSLGEGDGFSVPKDTIWFSDLPWETCRQRQTAQLRHDSWLGVNWRRLLAEWGWEEDEAPLESVKIIARLTHHAARLRPDILQSSSLSQGLTALWPSGPEAASGAAQEIQGRPWRAGLPASTKEGQVVARFYLSRHERFRYFWTLPRLTKRIEAKRTEPPEAGRAGVATLWRLRLDHCRDPAWEFLGRPSDRLTVTGGEYALWREHWATTVEGEEHWGLGAPLRPRPGVKLGGQGQDKDFGGADWRLSGDIAMLSWSAGLLLESLMKAAWRRNGLAAAWARGQENARLAQLAAALSAAGWRVLGLGGATIQAAIAPDALRDGAMAAFSLGLMPEVRLWRDHAAHLDWVPSPEDWPGHPCVGMWASLAYGGAATLLGRLDDLADCLDGEERDDILREVANLVQQEISGSH